MLGDVQTTLFCVIFFLLARFLGLSGQIARECFLERTMRAVEKHNHISLYSSSFIVALHRKAITEQIRQNKEQSLSLEYVLDFKSLQNLNWRKKLFEGWNFFPL